MRQKIVIAAALWLLLFISNRASAQVSYLDVGESVNQYPRVEWLKGTPIERFDKDKIYIVELWATWCKPCIEQMSHLSDLQSKFRDKIIFIGQNVMDPDIERVKEFITNHQDVMNYTLAYGGMEGSDFDKNWVKPSATITIPRTFVIQNNTLVWITTPDELNERTLQLLTDHKFSIEAAKEIK